MLGRQTKDKAPPRAQVLFVVVLLPGGFNVQLKLRTAASQTGTQFSQILTLLSYIKFIQLVLSDSFLTALISLPWTTVSPLCFHEFVKFYNLQINLKLWFRGWSCPPPPPTNLSFLPIFYQTYICSKQFLIKFILFWQLDHDFR